MYKALYSTTVLVIFLLLGLLNLQFQCNKNLDCQSTYYNFELGIRAYPDKDSINVGDTIWFEVSSPSTLPDSKTGQMIDYSGATNLGTVIGIAECLSTNTINVEGNQFFKFFPQSGREVFRTDTSRFREYSFAENNQIYQFRLAIVPQKKGVYKVFVSNANNVYRKQDKCTKADFTINFTNTDQHLYLNEIILPGVPLRTGGGVYLFKVI